MRQTRHRPSWLFRAGLLATALALGPWTSLLHAADGKAVAPNQPSCSAQVQISGDVGLGEALAEALSRRAISTAREPAQTRDEASVWLWLADTRVLMRKLSDAAA